MPGHIGIILNGNRRHASQHGVADLRTIYDLGAQKLDDVLRWCGELGIPAITLWVLSADNLRRPEHEISAILGAVQAKLSALAGDPRTSRQGVRVRAIGRLDLLPETTVEIIRSAERATQDHDRIVLTIAVGYGGREEITDAVRTMLLEQARDGASLIEAAERVTPDAISRFLYTAGLPDLDLIIRTSGEIRLSGFLLWQSAHSELYFTDVLWPAFRKIDFLRAIRTYQGRQRRFGR
jgi:short-chain Z-isoprenyl diphosphate synthase